MNLEIGASIFFTDYSMAQHSTAPLLDRGKPRETSHTTGQGKRSCFCRSTLRA